jgi:hypothetical protein
VNVASTAVVLGAALVVGGSPASAQLGYRNLDDERPVFTEDAYVLERFGFELAAPYRFEARAMASDAHVVAPELSYGAIPNLQVAVEAPLAALNADAEDEWGLAGLELSGVYNLNTESGGLPALTIRAEVQAPVGSLGGDVWRGAIRGIVSHSFGRARVHLNAARGIGSESGLSPLDPAPRWAYGLAGDYTLLRSSLLLVGETVVRRSVSGAPVEVNAGAGFRWQWTPTLVLDAGLSRRLADTGPDFGMTVGLTHTFGIRGLLPGRRAGGGAP